MALFYVTIRVSEMPKELEGFVEAASAQEALKKGETFLKNAPLLGPYQIKVMGEGQTITGGSSTKLLDTLAGD